MAEVSLENVDKHYGDIQVLFDVSLTVEEGEFVVFVGPSGCGKSTLLRAVAGLEDISAGTIRIGAQDVTNIAPAQRGVAMVFQSYALYPHMTVRANMDFGLKVNKVSATERQSRIMTAAKILQLEEYLDRKPAQLSGGQRQRVAIGRAIVKQPSVFLFDEPLSNLDAALRVQMRVELEHLHSALGSTMIYVTHDQIEAMTLANRIVVLNQGRTEQIGSPLDLYHRPQTRFVAGFIGSPKMNFIAARAAGAKAGAISLTFGEGSSITTSQFEPLEGGGEKLTLGIRPEHLIVCDAGEGDFPASVGFVEALGSETYIYADTPGGTRIVVRAQGDTPAVRGELIGLRIEAGREHLFHPDGRALARTGT